MYKYLYQHLLCFYLWIKQFSVLKSIFFFLILT